MESKIGGNSWNDCLSSYLGYSGNTVKLIFLSNSALKPAGWLDVAKNELLSRSDDGGLPAKGNLLRYYDSMNEAADKPGKYR